MFFRRRRKKPKSAEYIRHKEQARAVITERVEFFAETYSFEYKRIAIRNTKRSWGSCSSQQNLNFNYRLLFLPSELRDYVIVHELCHLRQFNHSPAFWSEVEKIMPEYNMYRRQLKLITSVRPTVQV